MCASTKDNAGSSSSSTSSSSRRRLRAHPTCRPPAPGLRSPLGKRHRWCAAPATPADKQGQHCQETECRQESPAEAPPSTLVAAGLSGMLGAYWHSPPCTRRRAAPTSCPAPHLSQLLRRFLLPFRVAHQQPDVLGGSGGAGTPAGVQPQAELHLVLEPHHVLLPADSGRAGPGLCRGPLLPTGVALGLGGGALVAPLAAELRQVLIAVGALPRALPAGSRLLVAGGHNDAPAVATLLTAAGGHPLCCLCSRAPPEFPRWRHGRGGWRSRAG